MEKKTQLEKTSKKLEKLFDLVPVDLKEPKEISTAMREALARMFGDPNLRGFLENAIKFANQSLIRSVKEDQMLFYKARIETLMQLLAMGKQHFVHFEMLQRKVEKQPLEKEVITKVTK